MDNEYINTKILNCKKLVKTAISEAQKAVYQGYLEFWQEKLGKNADLEKLALAKKEAEIKAKKEAAAKAKLEKALQIKKDKLAELQALKELEKEADAEVIKESE